MRLNCLKYLGVIFFFLVFVLSPKPAWAACPSGNLACGKYAWGSGVFQNYDYSKALDGDYSDSSKWVSGGYPFQQILIDLGGEFTIHQVKLLVAQLTAGNTNTVLYFTDSSQDWGRATTFTFDQYTSDGEWLTADVGVRNNVRYVGINTYTNPGWVAWREIEVYAPPASYSCSVSGSTNVTAGNDPTYTITSSGGPGAIQLYFTPTSHEEWQHVGNGDCPGTGCNLPVHFPAPGSYYVVCNAYDGNGNVCNGSPWTVPSGTYSCGNSSHIQVNVSEGPMNLQADWHKNGEDINTPYPLLSWDLPQNLLNQIDTVVVRMRKDKDMLGCKSDSIVEHWFTSSSSPSPCNIPATHVNSFSTGQPPNSFVLTPKNNLENNQTYYWSVYIHLLNGAWMGSDGFDGSSAISQDYFRTQFSPFTRNIFGINLYTNSQLKERGIMGNQQAINNLFASHLDWARLVSGVNGFVKLFFYGISNNTQSANPEWKSFVQMAYDRQLVPIIRLQGPWIKGNLSSWGGSWSAPTADPDGNYTQAAQAYKRVVADLPKQGNTPIFIELYNELNLSDGNWSGASDPAVVPLPFAKFFVATYDAIHELNDPRIKVIIGGFAPGNYNLKSLNKMLEVSGFKERIIKDGYWTNHFYPSKWFNFDDPTTYQSNVPRGLSANDGPFIYKYELDQLARAGVDVTGVKVIFSEGGWSISDESGTQENLRSENTLKLLDLFVKDNNWIGGITFFALDGFADVDVLDQSNPLYDPRNLNSDFGKFAWVSYDSTDQNGRPSQPHKVFNDVANFIKQSFVTGMNKNPAPNPYPGDLNGDKIVNSADADILKSDFDKTGSAGFIPSDINKDGVVDIFDYNILVSNFGKNNIPPTNVPPPTSTPVPPTNIPPTNPPPPPPPPPNNGDGGDEKREIGGGKD